MRISDWSSDVCSSDLAGGYFLDDQGDFRHAQCRPAICFRQGDATKSRIANRLPRLVRKSVRGILVTPILDTKGFADTTRRVLDHSLLIGESKIHHIAHQWRSEEHTSELKSLMRISYAVFCLKKT